MAGECTYIYCLIDPRDDEVRYVGKADNVLRRYRQHCKPKLRTPVCEWVRSLAEQGLTPVVASLARCLRSDWQEMESLFIAKYRLTSKQLLNVANGGDSTANPHQMSGQKGEMARLKWKLSLCLRDKYLSDRSRERIKARMRGIYRQYPGLFDCWRNL